MAVTFACSETSGFVPVGAPVEDVTGGRFRAAYSRASLQCNPFSYYHAFAPAAIVDGWIKFHCWVSFWDSDDADNWLQIFQDGISTSFLRMFISSNGTVCQFQYWNGAAWVGIGAAFNITSTFGGMQEYAFKITCGVGGTASLFINGILQATGSIGNATVNFRQVRLTCGDATGGAQEQYSEVVFGDNPTSLIGTAVETEAPTSAGADSTDGTGSHLDIDEAAISDVDALILTAAGQKRSFKSPARTGTLEAVLAVTVAARANRGSSGPTRMKFYLVLGGTRYYSPNIDLALGYSGYQWSWPVRPDNGFAWAPAEANDANLEWGVEAVA